MHKQHLCFCESNEESEERERALERDYFYTHLLFFILYSIDKVGKMLNNNSKGPGQCDLTLHLANLAIPHLQKIDALCLQSVAKGGSPLFTTRT